MPDIKLLNILRITYKLIGDQHESRKFKSKAIDVSNSPSCRTNRALLNEIR